MRALAVAIALAALLSTAAAQQPPKDAAAEDASIHGYGDTDKTCQEWTDSCRICTRSETDEPVCSNIAIACQPKAIACVRRAEEKKEEKK
jgi:invasion protein IalB